MELLLKLTPAITSALFSLGGTGYKWARRFLLPIYITIVLLLGNNPFWISVLTGTLIGVGFHLPYGDSLPKRFRYTLRCLVMSTYFLPVLLTTGLQLLNIVVAISCTLIATLMFWISNQKWGEKWLTWWIWEPTVGFLVGINLTMARL